LEQARKIPSKHSDIIFIKIDQHLENNNNNNTQTISNAP